MQLEWMIEFTKYRTNFTNTFFKLVNFFDTPYFFFCIIPFIIIGISYRWGVRFFYLTILNGVVNYSLKIFFQVPRPCSIEPKLALVHVSNYSFPSGAAQYSIILAGLLIATWRSSWAKVVGISYVLIIGFSRVYLGVHYPTDILFGWFVGGTILFLFLKLYQPLENHIKKEPKKSLFLATFLPLFLVLTTFNVNIINFMSLFFAFSIGVYISTKYKLYLKDPKNILESILRGLFAIATTNALLGLLLILFGKQNFTFNLISNLAAAIWISLIISPIINIIKKNRIIY
ncbi:MAG: phosphatase PAP2 family protein [Chlamydiota bacterium]|jgi:membrane-associated phospholipid phosphatase